MTDRHDCQLYLVTPPEFDPAAFAPLVEEALAAGPVACLQLWLPEADDDRLRTAAKALRGVVQGHDTAFVINGHVKLAAYLGCDGVHLDHASAADVKAAKKVLGEDSIVGVSARTSRHEAMNAGEAGADYVSFGPVFDTATKGLPADPAALSAIEWWGEMMEVPCVAVGGITADNLTRPVEAGADFICAVSAVWNHPDGPGAGVRALTRALKATR
ncbi:thiamine phosphate synthase [Marivibrio halodurans]|uniref:Thiamine phosphate synthase n=1 Tax=Marivibrio halodurans TaxID=2039722 RepID=A0A8J7RZR6_9PROT|nr:thiamine phosphate synthase [Marivibrio halodurans]MBP5857702.1 thiamine phosphate synthase [Marivibrio halodurans]